MVSKLNTVLGPWIELGRLCRHWCLPFKRPPNDAYGRFLVWPAVGPRTPPTKGSPFALCSGPFLLAKMGPVTPFISQRKVYPGKLFKSGFTVEVLVISGFFLASHVQGFFIPSNSQSRYDQFLLWGFRDVAKMMCSPLGDQFGWWSLSG